MERDFRGLRRIFTLPGSRLFVKVKNPNQHSGSADANSMELLPIFLDSCWAQLQDRLIRKRMFQCVLASCCLTVRLLMDITFEE